MQGAVLDAIRHARTKRSFFLTIAGGAFAVLGHAPFFFWPAFLIAFAVFFVRLEGFAAHDGPVGKSAFWAGWAFGFGYFLASLFWIASAFITRGGGYVWLAPFGAMLLPAGLAFFWAFAALAYVRLRRIFGPQMWRATILFAALFFTAEFLRGHILSGFPWNLPGYIWEAGKPVSQSAAWWGIYGLSFLTILWAACVGAALCARITVLRAAPAALLSVGFAALYVSGQARLSAAASYADQDGPKIRVISTALTQNEKYDRGNYIELINHYLELSFSDGAPGISAIIWSEGAIPGLVLEDDGLMAALDSLLSPNQILIMGATRRVFDPDALSDNFGGQWHYYNSLVGIERTGTGLAKVVATYDKQKLVPFGEYFPANGLISDLKIPALTRAVSSFDRGRGAQPNYPGLPAVSAQICYESIFSGFTDRAQNSPEWILNISNDSWFGPTTGPRQHFNQVKYRAIEQGLPIVRSAASGLSGFVDAYGRDIVIDDGKTARPIDAALPAKITPTPFATLSD